MTREACVETLEHCLQAEQRGADRIELCADLAQDGLTPARELIRQVKKQLTIPVRVMIRPRPGDFVYSEKEMDLMKESILSCMDIGVEGIVFGVCTPDNQLNIEAISYLAKLAKPLKVTIHKAIDHCENPLNELSRLQGLGIDAVLSSGKASTAREGSMLLKQMVENARTIEVIACGKITNENLDEIDRLVGAPAYHGKKIVGAL